MSAMPNLSKLHRVTRAHPCPVCRKLDWCEYGDDDRVHCMRVESGVPANRSGGGWWHNLPGRETTSPTIFAPEPEPLPERADAATCDAVYRTCLEIFPTVAAHRDNLISRGLPADGLGYFGTMPPASQRGPALAQLEARYGRPILLTVPGFAEEDGKLRLIAATGLLLAVVGNDGLIVALNVRSAPPGGKKEYIWVSSRSAGGPSSGSPCHVVKPEGAPTHKVLVTEGVIKAEIAARHMGLMTIGMVGHNPHAAALDLLAELAQQGVEIVIIAFDEDAVPETRVLVEKSRRRFAVSALEMKLHVRYARWNHADGKGIDDLLVNGHQPTIEPVNVVLVDVAPPEETVDDDPGSATVIKNITIPQQAARYRELRNIIWGRVTPDPAVPDGPKRAATATQKLTLMMSYEMGNYPGASVPEASSLKKVSVTVMAACCGSTRQTVTDSLKSLAKVSLIRHKVDPPTKDSEHTIVSIAAGRRLGFNEVLPKPERAEKARKAAEKKRACKECGSTDVIVELVQMEQITCKTCSAITTERPGAAAERAAGGKFTPHAPYQKRERAHQLATLRANEEERRAAEGHEENLPTPVDADNQPIRVAECNTTKRTDGVTNSVAPTHVEILHAPPVGRTRGAPWDGRPAIESYPWYTQSALNRTAPECTVEMQRQ